MCGRLGPKEKGFRSAQAAESLRNLPVHDALEVRDMLHEGLIVRRQEPVQVGDPHLTVETPVDFTDGPNVDDIVDG
jgi:hypothetical protein